MARRPRDEQDLHDRVIGAIAATLSKSGRAARTNPGRVRENSVAGYFPDVLAVEGDVVRTIYEVETWSSVEKRHAEHQWAAFAALGLPVFLVVPADTLDEARRILELLGLDRLELVGFEEEAGAIIFTREITSPASARL